MSCAGSNQKPKHNVNTKLTTVKSESNGAYLHKRGPVVEATWELLPHLLREETGTLWYPERGVWYTAERSGTVGGGWGGGGSGAWSDPGIKVKIGDRFRVVSRGSVSSPSVWEVEFTSPL